MPLKESTTGRINGGSLDRAIVDVVSARNCSGCGACTALDLGLQMALDREGFSRPVRVPGGEVRPSALAKSRRSCPGVSVAAQAPTGSVRHSTMGRVIPSSEAWATDPEVRHRPRIGGAVTASTTWVLTTGEVSRVVGARGDDGDPRRTVTVTRSSRADVVAALGIPPAQPLAELWHRGRGWPGRFTAIAESGQRVEASYDDSWGRHLGPAVQWRCKICPDGIGESADITAADYWRADSSGYPEFSESPGVSALIARTRRGRDLVERAIAAGVIQAEPLDLDALARMQPLQVNRRSTLVGRLVGARLGGASVPRYKGFALLALGVKRPRQLVRVARGILARVRVAGRS